MRVFDNRVLKGIFGWDEVMGGWRKIHCEELHKSSFTGCC
jgi:hypothetical protein